MMSTNEIQDDFRSSLLRFGFGISFKGYITKETHSSFISLCCVLLWWCDHSYMHYTSQLWNLLKFNMAHAELYTWPLVYTEHKQWKHLFQSVLILFHNFISDALNAWCTKILHYFDYYVGSFTKMFVFNYQKQPIHIKN